MSDLPPAARRVASAATELDLTIDVVAFPEGTRTADDAARAVGCAVGQIVKSLVFMVDNTPVLALVSGANRLDEKKLGEAGGGGAAVVRRADATAVRAATGYAVGGVPPFGHAQVLRTFMDADLLTYDEVWAAAGTPEHVFAVDPSALASATDAEVVDLAERA